jgi:hypothetical protein
VPAATSPPAKDTSRRIIGTILMSPACRWYRSFKNAHPTPVLKYF